MKVNNHACILAGITCYASASLKIIMQASLHQIFKLVSMISYYMKVEMQDIIINNISKSFDCTEVLKNYSAVLRCGRIYRLEAPSGAGKTTLMRILMGLVAPDSGSISGIPHDISVMFQEDRLIESLSAVDNISITAPDMAAMRLKCTEDLSALGLADYMHMPVRELSGGMKRRVCLIRAMLHASDLVLLDEPFTGLDAALISAVSRYILDRADGRTMLIASHIPDAELTAHSELLNFR